MRNWKKYLACLLAGVLALAVLTACDGLAANAGVIIKGVNAASEADCAALAKQIGVDAKYSEDLTSISARNVANFLTGTSVELKYDEETDMIYRVTAADWSEITNLEQGDLESALFDYGCLVGTKEKVGIAYDSDSSRKLAYFYVAKSGIVTDAMRNAAKGKTEMGAYYIITDKGTYTITVFR